MKLRYLLALAVVPVLVLKADEEPGLLLVFVMLGVLGLPIARRLRPGIGELWPPRRLPRPSEVIAMCLGLILAALFVGLATWCFSLPERLGSAASVQPWEAVLSDALLALALIAAVVPSALWLWRSRQQTDARPVPLWPSVVTLLAVLPLALAVQGILALARDKLAVPNIHPEEIGELFVFLPPMLLIVGGAGMVYWRAATAGWTSRFETAGILEAGLMGARAAFVLAVAAATVLIAFPTLRGRVSDEDTIALVSGLAYALAIIAAWLIVFRSIDRLRETNLWVILCTLIGLVPALLFSFALSGALMQSGMWAWLFMIAGLVFLALDVGLILGVGKIVSLVSRRTQRILVERMAGA